VSLIETIGDAINPIVVKELRQAVQSRFVVAVLLVFLLVQLVFMGIYIMLQSLDGSLHTVDYQSGRRVFMILQGILLATCMLCIPAYSGFRLAGERSEVHVDLFYISTLRPRAIVAGKFIAALVLTVLIFSACTPFMTFTYFLRGIDLASIFVVVGLDFLVVALTSMVALFVAVVPAGRVLKVLLGVGGLVLGMFAFFYGIGVTVSLLDGTLPLLLESVDFRIAAVCTVVVAVGAFLFLFTATVGLLSPPSANRTFGMRVTLTLFFLLSAPLLFWCGSWAGAEWPITIWLSMVDTPLAICLLIAINERESWGPRVARTIPRRWWLRPPAFLFYSGAAGGVLWACLLGTACVIATWIVLVGPAPILPLAPDEELPTTCLATLATLGYAYGFAMTAVLLRNTVVRIPALYTWVLALGLAAVCSGLPFFLTFLVYFRDWDLLNVYPWLLPSPVAGEMVLNRVEAPEAGNVVLVFLGCWAFIMTILNGRWYLRQMRNFRPYAGAATSMERVPALLSATPMDVTRTAP
jgi:hypothetical protein